MSFPDIQCLNGDMSFVGPRPERPYFVNQLMCRNPLLQRQAQRQAGNNGMGTVRYLNGASVEERVEKLQYDLYYVKNHSLFLDVIILIETVEVVLLGKGGR